MKSVMLSIHPEYCMRIANREKLVEIRKTAPNIDTPFTCYIYCTKNNARIKCSRDCEYFGMQEMYRYCGECPYIDGIGKVIGEFTCDNIEAWSKSDALELNPVTGRSHLCEMACLSLGELEKYRGNTENVYAWHISNPIMYDKPKEIGEFLKYNRSPEDCYYSDLGLAIPDCKDCMRCKITRPPQSWCYCETVK